MSSTTDHQVFAVRLMGLEAIGEVIMPIRIRCPDESLHREQTTEHKGQSALMEGNLMALYADRKTKLRSLSGSV